MRAGQRRGAPARHKFHQDVEVCEQAARSVSNGSGEPQDRPSRHGRGDNRWAGRAHAIATRSFNEATPTFQSLAAAKIERLLDFLDRTEIDAELRAKRRRADQRINQSLWAAGKPDDREWDTDTDETDEFDEFGEFDPSDKSKATQHLTG